MNQRPPHTTLPNQTLEQADFLHFFPAAARNGYMSELLPGPLITVLGRAVMLLVFYKEHAPPPAQSATLSSSPPNFP